MDIKYGDILKTLLEEKNISQKDLACKIGVTEATISKYINNLQMPRLDLVQRIATTLNITTDYLLGRKNTSNTVEQIDKKLQDNNIAIAANSKVDLGKLAQVDNKTARLINTLIDDFLADDEEYLKNHTEEK